MEFKKYDKIKAIGHEDNKGIFDDANDDIVIQEKVDGGNFRIFVNNGKIIFGSRTQQLTSDDGDDTNVEKSFKSCIAYLRLKLLDKDLTRLHNHILFGECMIKHSINYDWDKTPRFIGYDIWSMDEERYLDWKKSKQIYEDLGLEFVPIIKEIKSSDVTADYFTDDFVPQSKYGIVKAEGIVFKNYDKKLFAKYVRAGFKEKNKEAFGSNKKYANNDNEWLRDVYCTNARIEKQIYKLIDDGNDLDLKLMSLLPNLVHKDIWEENWQEISNLKKTINLHNFKKLISKRCLVVLNNMITNNAIFKSDEEKIEYKSRDYIEDWCIRYDDEYCFKEPESYLLELELCYFNQINEIPLMSFDDLFRLMEIYDDM